MSPSTFSSHVGTEPTLPGFNQYSLELHVMYLAQGHNTVPPVGFAPRTS